MFSDFVFLYPASWRFWSKIHLNFQWCTFFSLWIGFGLIWISDCHFHGSLFFITKVVCLLIPLSTLVPANCKVPVIHWLIACWEGSSSLASVARSLRPAGSVFLCPCTRIDSPCRLLISLLFAFLMAFVLFVLFSVSPLSVLSHLSAWIGCV